MLGKRNNWNELVAAILADHDARTAYLENNLRNRFGERLSSEMVTAGISTAELCPHSLSCDDMSRLLNDVKGDPVTLREMVRVADALGYDLEISWKLQSDEVHDAKEPECSCYPCDSCLNKDVRGEPEDDS